MHIHNAQLDPNLLQIAALSATARADEKKQAELTRKQLHKAASSLAGDYEDDCVVSLSGETGSGSGSDSDAQDQRTQRNPETREEQTTEDTTIFSDWA